MGRGGLHGLKRRGHLGRKLGIPARFRTKIGPNQSCELNERRGKGGDGVGGKHLQRGFHASGGINEQQPRNASAKWATQKWGNKAGSPFGQERGSKKKG